MRVLAAQLVGIHSIPAIVRDLTDSQMLKLGLIENLKRKDFNIVEGQRLQNDARYLAFNSGTGSCRARPD